MNSESDRNDLVLRALADSTRRLIIDELDQHDGQTLFEVCGRLSMKHSVHISRQAVTKHLDVLESAGILTVKWQGRTKIHHLNTGPIKEMGQTWLNRYLE